MIPTPINHSIKALIIISFLVSVKCFSQKPLEIYYSVYSKSKKCNKFYAKLLGLEKSNRIINLYEKDSLVLYDDGSFKKYYQNNFYDEIRFYNIVGKWYKNNSILILKPEKEIESDEKPNNEPSDYSEILLDSNNSNFIKYKDKTQNRKIRKLKKSSTTA